ncbi:DUF1097 domain-containing protein [Psychrobacter frigidicola]|uniref:DUF1097 domain-containing protein n=1 Tax=Psychrobacter frigidicola TaxID=45611 RepID=A0A5C7A747_9GAMM|nr:DUF1097 domain-containing protein [Psychrobacter frigidicola]TXD98480.1 DUF1097 domain-containing protein [Psychrobacter frigidicola]
MDNKLIYTLGTAAVTGILCGLWGGYAGAIGLVAWAGFASTTAYFATGMRYLSGFFMTIITTMFGVAFAWLMLQGAAVLGGSNAAYALAVGIFVTCIVLMGQIKWTGYVPGIFVGTYSLFAMPDNNVPLLVLSLLAGAILGLACDWLGKALFAKYAPTVSEKATA